MDVYILPVLNPDGYHHTWTSVGTWGNLVGLGSFTREKMIQTGSVSPPLFSFPLCVPEQNVEEKPLDQRGEWLHRGRPEQKL